VKPIAAFMLLVVLCGAWSIPATAQRISVEENARQSNRSEKKRQKMLKKADKRQRRAMKKHEKAQRKAVNQRHRWIAVRRLKTRFSQNIREKWGTPAAFVV
jgi:hypothetical protein